MHAVVGPILVKDGCYAFDLWTPEDGLRCGFAYRRIEDAHYARNAEIRSRKRGLADAAIACGTLHEFTLAVAEREATFCALVSNLEVRSVSQTHVTERYGRVSIGVVKETKLDYSLSGTPASSSLSHTAALASEGARQSPRGDKEPPDEIFGPLGRAERLNWLSWKKR